MVIRLDAGSAASIYETLLVSLRILIGVLMLSAIGINFANVVARRLFDAPFIWVEEALVYCVVWIVFIGAVLVSWSGTHLRMDLWSSRMSKWPALAVNGLVVLITLAVSVYVVAHSWLAVLTLFRTGQESIAAGIPLYLPHLAVPLGFLLIFLGALISARRQLMPVHGGRPDSSGA